MKLPLRPWISAAATIRAGSRHTAAPALLRPVLQGLSSLAAHRGFSATSPCRNDGSGMPATEKKVSEPLRILFCGSDEFSCAHLQALHEEHLRNPGLIESIDVVVRPGKRTGRGYKKIQHPPLRDVATELGLPIHERDTFTGWDMPAPTNLIIAVSFGLFVPRRLLRAARYGGLNVHPSLLPEFRGAAPLHHALLARRRRTGVSLQTLDAAAFDAGAVLAQTGLDGTDIVAAEEQRRDVDDVEAVVVRVDGADTEPALRRRLTPLAARMLVRGLRDGVHVPPHVDVGWWTRRQRLAERGEDRGEFDWPDETARAPKITSHMRQLFLPSTETHGSPTETAAEPAPWSFGASDAALRQRIIGPLWFVARNPTTGAWRRVIIEGEPSVVDINVDTSLTADSAPGPGSLHRQEQQLGTITVRRDASALTAVRSDAGAVGESPLAAPTPVQVWLPAQTEDHDQAVYILEGEQPAAETRTQNRSAPASSPSSSPASAPGRASRALRVECVKVEGEKARPARAAMAPFVRLGSADL